MTFEPLASSVSALRSVMDQATDPPRRYVRSLMRLSGRLRSPEIRLPMPASWTLWRAWICRQWHTCGMKTGSSHSPSLSGRPKSSPCDQRRLPLRDVVCDVAPASALRRALPGTSCLSLGIGEAMNDFRSTGVSAEGGGSDIGRKALWVIREFGLPAIVKAGVSCRSTRHHPTGKFCVNANGKLLDVWIRAPARSAIYKGGPLLGLTGDRVFAGHVVFSSALGPGCLAAGMAGGAVRSRR